MPRFALKIAVALRLRLVLAEVTVGFADESGGLYRIETTGTRVRLEVPES